MNLRHILCSTFTSSIFLLSSLASAKPNIVWIFSDDHSFQTIGAYGGRLKSLNPTPNIDKIASEGIRFDRCYVENSICGPSRACLLTGKFSHLHGKTRNGRAYAFNQSQQTFPKILQKNGYQTAMIGKIHLDGDMQGFDFWQVLPGQGHYNNPTFLIDKSTDTQDGKQDGKIQVKGYVSDVITDKALEWLDKKRDKSKPFMLMIHHKAAHRTWIPDTKDMDEFENITIPEPDSLFDDYSNRGTPAHHQTMEIDRTMIMGYDLKVDARHAKSPQWAKRNAEFKKLKAAGKLEGKNLVRWKYQQYMKDYLRCIRSMDRNVGRVLNYLKENGLEENTIVFYSSDQGFYMGAPGWFDKRFMYEESFRTPLIARWPGHIKPGTSNSDLAQNIDFAETFLDLAGIKAPSEMQGVSLVPLLKGETPSNWRKSLYYRYYEFPAEHSVRKHEGVAEKRFKLIRFYGPNYKVIDPKTGKKVQLPPEDEWEFYDLQKDPHEMKNEYSNPEYAVEIKRMKAELKELRTQYKVPDGDADPVVFRKK
jgi:arylsulfatase A-like enzyme